MFAQHRIERLVDSVRNRVAIPLRIELWDGRRLDLSEAPCVTVHVPSASVLRHFFHTDLNRLGEAYVEGLLDVEGSVHDMFRVAQSFAHGWMNLHQVLACKDGHAGAKALPMTREYMYAR